MNIAIIPAAGSGTRFGKPTPKQFVEIAGAPIIVHTLRKFAACREIDLTIVALRQSEFESFGQMLSAYGLGREQELRLVEGGAERSESVLKALEAAAAWQPELVAVHDAVRPLVTPEQISAVLARARETGAAILALPATDTIKEAEQGIIRQTLDRRRIYLAQTPQAFRYELLRRANQEARAAGLPPALLTDDSLLVERLGEPVAIVEGTRDNVKITTPEDLALAERILERQEFKKPLKTGDRQTPAGPGPAEIRAGIGHDIHRLVEDRKLILGGIEIPFERGLLGHSDGDSLTHAIIDALLGAAGLGDIGRHFSDQDPRWSGADSLEMLRSVSGLVRAEGYRIANIDATILAERPKLMPQIPGMRAKLAEALKIDLSQLNIKAKTNEGLDAVGRGEAIAAQAMALIARI
ncbi:MAG TPA: 2-C-methyl-D-erythritol 4-phosphate cytidylyltransferase [Blastocatellia bacterium]|nr:2-C-methyl-D-erythritol 4-phosphate cytidylyltransferase [Blastocatellia bacterium]